MLRWIFASAVMGHLLEHRELERRELDKLEAVNANATTVLAHDMEPVDHSFFSVLFMIACCLAMIPMMGWCAYQATQYFTRPKPIAAPLLGDMGDLQLSEESINSVFDGRQMTEYCHLTV